ncbi:MAG: MFS transporter [Candidatus Bipolaricaulota bacterium]|nr:MFS transporter [Candidatus Bipolaricaulota bacterium]
MRTLGGRLREELGRFDRGLWALVAGQLITSAGFSLALPFLSLYLHRERGLPMTVVGAVALANGIVSAVGRVVGGELGDRVGRRATVLGAVGGRVALFGGLAVLVARDGPVGAIVGVYLAVRITGALAMTAITALVADAAEGGRRMEAYGFLRVGANVGWAAGPALGGLLASFYPYWTLFAATAGLTAAAFGLLLRYAREIGPGRGEEGAPAEIRGLLADRPFLLFVGFSFLVFVVAGQLVSTLSVFTVDRLGYSPAHFGGLLTLNGLLVVAFQYPLARATAAWPRRGLLVGGSVLYALGYLLVGLVRAYPGLLLAIGVVTLGEMLFAPSALAVAAELAGEGRRGRYLGVYGLAETLGWSVGGFLGGVLLDLFPTQPLGTWGTVAAVGGLAALGFSRWARPRRG